MERFTTLEQSKKLAEVWKDAETEKVWVAYEYPANPENNGLKLRDRLMAEKEWGWAATYGNTVNILFPAFSLTDILERLPAEIKVKFGLEPFQTASCFIEMHKGGMLADELDEYCFRWNNVGV